MLFSMLTVPSAGYVWCILLMIATPLLGVAFFLPNCASVGFVFVDVWEVWRVLPFVYKGQINCESPFTAFKRTGDAEVYRHWL